MMWLRICRAVMVLALLLMLVGLAARGWPLVYLTYFAGTLAATAWLSAVRRPVPIFTAALWPLTAWTRRFARA